MAPPFRQNHRRLDAAVPDSVHARFRLWRKRPPHRTRHGGRIHTVYFAAAGLVHHFRRYSGVGQPARLAQTQHCAFGHRHPARPHHGHHRRGHADDSPAAESERQPQTQRARRDFLYLFGGQHRRRPHTAGRPTTVLGLPERRGLPVDGGAHARPRADFRRCPAHHFLYHRQPLFRQRRRTYAPRPVARQRRRHQIVRQMEFRLAALRDWLGAAVRHVEAAAPRLRYFGNELSAAQSGTRRHPAGFNGGFAHHHAQTRPRGQ